MACPKCEQEGLRGATYCSACGKRVAKDPGALALPSFGAGRYTAELLIGEGAHKRVYRARDTRLDRDVAVSWFKTELLDADGRKRLARELETLARIGDHPHIAAILDLGEEERRPFLISRYCEGGSVAELLLRSPKGRLPVVEALGLASEVARALDHAHCHAVLHRDIKPANLWLDRDGSLRLGDFGLASFRDRLEISGSEPLIGTVAYASPEQVRGETVDERSDFYALGATLYELLTGRPPFTAATPVAVVSQHLNSEPVSPSWVEAGLPLSVDRLVLSLLSKDREQRPPHAKALIEALDQLRQDLGDGEAARRTTASLNELLPNLGGQTQRNPLDRLAGGVFVGRRAEMERLKRAFNESAGGVGRIVALVGEAGVGKSRTATELATYASLRGARVLTGKCPGGVSCPAYRPWTRILARYVDEVGERAAMADLGSIAPEVASMSEELGQRLPSAAAPTSLEPDRARFRLFDGLASFFAKAAERRPLVLLLEDLHWADRDTLELLEFLVDEVAEASLLIVATWRASEVVKDSPLEKAGLALRRGTANEELPLRGLTEEEVGELVRAVIGGEVPAPLVSRLHDDTGGNPFFVEEVLRSLTEQGLFDEQGASSRLLLDLATLPVPRGVSSVLSARVARLSADCRSLLATASVVGREFDITELASLLQEEQAIVAERVAEAVAARVVRSVRGSVARYRFEHALGREVLYSELDAGDVHTLHKGIAQRLEASGGPSDYAEIAHHYHRTALAGGAEKAAEFSIRAAARSTAKLAYEEAVYHYSRAREVWSARSSPDELGECQLLLDLGHAHHCAGHGAEASLTFAAAGDLARSLVERQEPEGVELLGKAAFGIGDLWGVSGLVDQAMVARLEEALGHMDGDSALRAKLLSRLGVALYWSDRVAERERLTREGLEMARRCKDTAAEAYALAARRFAIWSPDNLQEQLGLAHELVEIGERTQHLEGTMGGRFWLIIDLLGTGDFPGAAREIDTYLRYAEESRQPFFRWYATVACAMRAFVCGDLAGSERLAGEALTIGQRGQVSDAEQFFGLQALQIAYVRGEAAALAPYVIEFVAKFPGIPAWRAVLAALYADGGREEDAKRELDTLFDGDFAHLPQDCNLLVACTFMIEACVRVGDAPRALKVAALLEPFADQHVVVANAAGYFGPVAYFLGVADAAAGNDEPAERRLRAAAAEARRIGAPIAALRAELALAELLAARNATLAADEIRQLAEAAAKVAGAQNLRPSLARAERLLEGCAQATPEPEGGSQAQQYGGSPEPGGEARLTHEGEFWSLLFGGRVVRVRDTKGVHYLSRLLLAPSQELHVLDLVGELAGETVQPSDAGPLLDEQAKAAYRARVMDLQSELDEAEADNDLGRKALLRGELDALTAELSRAVGLGGRDRRAASQTERARLNVTRSVRAVLKRLSSDHPELAAHLDTSIKTGQFCSYNPDPAEGPGWVVGSV